MKKVLSVLLAVFMLAGICMMSVFAAPSGAGIYEGDAERTGVSEANFVGGSNTADVKIQINGAINHTYAVDITFTAPVFTLSTGATWNAEDHKYEHIQPIVWNGTGEVVVTNHSDLSITYEAEAAVTTDAYGPLSIVFNGATAYAPITATVINACLPNPTTVPSAEFTYGVVGEPTVAVIETPAVLGTITVTVKPVINP